MRNHALEVTDGAPRKHVPVMRTDFGERFALDTSRSAAGECPVVLARGARVEDDAPSFADFVVRYVAEHGWDSGPILEIDEPPHPGRTVRNSTACARCSSSRSAAAGESVPMNS